MRATLFPRRAAAADATAIVVFAVVGLVSHEHGVSARGLARDALPILGGWFACALVLGLYRSRRPARLAATWAVGVTAGVATRAAILGHDDVSREAAFLGVSLAVTLVFVLVGRFALGTVSGSE